MGSGHHGFIPASAEDALRYRMKAELRKRMRGLRNLLPPSAWVERSARIVDALAAAEPVLRAKRVALFWPIEARREVDLRTLDAALRARGVSVAYPAVTMGQATMRFHFVSGLECLREVGNGFREPEPQEPEARPGDLDVIVVPALAIDSSGYRIGYGGGYYDGTLPLHAPPATTVGVAFDFQLLAEIPATDGDVCVDWVITDQRSMASDRQCNDSLR